MKKKKFDTRGCSHTASDKALSGNELTDTRAMQGENRMMPAYALMVFVISFFIYGFNYSYSPGLFWDENYHITSAQKYIDGVFFMGDHPPLGKELVALGEVMLHPNRHVDTSAFLTAEKTENVPNGYSFTGMRFMPAFLAVLSGAVFFFLLLALLKNAHLAFLFSGLYLFENAFVVHSRGAMLDSIQLFFVLASLLCFASMLEQTGKKLGSYLMLGMLLGASTAVKLNALLFFSLPLVLFFIELRRKDRSIKFVLQSGVVSAAGFLLVFLGSYVVHIYLTPHVLKDRYYEASPAYREILDKGETRQLRHLPLQLMEHLEFIPKYQKGVPQYDPTKPEENGSLPYTWPFMNKTINYRWEKNDSGVRYLYLVGNPLSWLIGLIAVIVSTLLVLSRLIVKTPVRNSRTFQLILIFTALYWFYMAVMLKLERVMYLYHYFIPLVSSYILAALLFSYFFEKGLDEGNKKLYTVTAMVILSIFAIFLFFSPLSYYQPLTSEQFQLRSWFPWWKMAAVR